MQQFLSLTDDFYKFPRGTHQIRNIFRSNESEFQTKLIDRKDHVKLGILGQYDNFVCLLEPINRCGLRKLLWSVESTYLYGISQRTRPNIAVTGLRHFLAGADVTFAGWHRRTLLQSVPDARTAVQQHDIAEHHATPSSIVYARWAEQSVVRL